MSIRRYLVMMLLSVITLVTFFAAIGGYKASMQKAADLFDGELVLLAEALILLDPDALQTKTTADRADIAFQIFHGQQLLLKTINAPNQAMSQQFDEPLQDGFTENNFLGQRWRTYVKRDNVHHKTVIVAQPLQHRFELAEEMILSAVTPIILAIPFLTLLISFTIRQGLSPLTHLNNELMSKKANDLSLLQTSTQNNELKPVITTLNQLFDRLSLAFERERHFASDAAHELRTPLSVLKINVHNLKHELAAVADNHRLLAPDGQVTLLQHSVERMAHVVDQILTLNRTSPEQITLSSEPLDLTTILQQTISDLYPKIVQQSQHIALNGQAKKIKGNAFAIATLCQNLIGNAIKYTPNEGEISVTIADQDHSVVLTVEDSGGGIAPAEYERVFDRFYRVGGDRHVSKALGCGLGLAIVKHIVQLHEAHISLAQSPTLKGLKVTVRFVSCDQAKKEALHG